MSISDDKVLAFTFEHKNQPDRPNTLYTTQQFKILLDTQAEQLQAGLNGLIDNILSALTGDSGAHNVGSATITGVAGNTVYAQLTDLKVQIQAIVGGSIPPGSVTTAMIQDGAVTYPKLNPAPASVPTANRLMLYDANGRSQVNAPVSGNDITNKTYVDTAVGTNIARLITGTYTGDGTASRNISTTVTPKLIYVTGYQNGSNNVSSISLTGSLSAMTVGADTGSPQTFTTNLPNQAIPAIISGGFTVTGTSGNGLNVNTRVYTYAVFY